MEFIAQIPADLTVLHPFPDQPRVVLLKPLVTSELIDVGEYSYYDEHGAIVASDDLQKVAP